MAPRTNVWERGFVVWGVSHGVADRRASFFSLLPRGPIGKEIGIVVGPGSPGKPLILEADALGYKPIGELSGRVTIAQPNFEAVFTA